MAISARNARSRSTLAMPRHPSETTATPPSSSGVARGPRAAKLITVTECPFEASRDAICTRARSAPPSSSSVMTNVMRSGSAPSNSDVVAHCCSDSHPSPNASAFDGDRVSAAEQEADGDDMPQ